MNLIKKVPIPICGVALGFAALGNLIQMRYNGAEYAAGNSIRNVCGIIAAVLLVLMLLKLITCPKAIAEDFKNPIMASVAGTFPMALMLLSTYAKPFIGGGAYYIWLLAIALHVILIVFFTVRFIAKLQMPKVFASYYIVYVGIVVAAVTAPAYEKQTSIGTATFWFGFVALIALLILVTIRYVKYTEIPNPAKPLICIYAAPTSLCIAGYVQSVAPKNKTFLLAMFAVATVIYVFALVKAIQFMKLPFFPSYASFTFPFVISAIATKQTMACLKKMESPMPQLRYLVLIETIIAVCFCVYTLIRFCMFLTAGEKK